MASNTNQYKQVLNYLIICIPTAQPVIASSEIQNILNQSIIQSISQHGILK
jgi:hypothetical protein